MVLSGMTITPARNLKVAFVGPYIVTGKSILTKQAAVESSYIRVDRRPSQEPSRNLVLQLRDAEGIPLHISQHAQSSEREFKSKLESASASAEAEHGRGMIHMRVLLLSGHCCTACAAARWS
jgi:ABC-type amino acid transport substrate-binding protein